MGEKTEGRWQVLNAISGHLGGPLRMRFKLERRKYIGRKGWAGRADGYRCSSLLQRPAEAAKRVLEE